MFTNKYILFKGKNEMKRAANIQERNAKNKYYYNNHNNNNKNKFRR